MIGFDPVRPLRSTMSGISGTLPPAMAWIRRVAETPERRPIDVVRFVVGGFGVVVVGMWAQTQTSINANLFAVVNDLPGSLENFGRGVFAMGSIWGVAVVAVLTVVVATHQWRMTLQAVLAGVGAWGIAELLNDLLGDHSLDGIPIHLREGSVPTYPSANVAVITALAIVLAPYLVARAPAVVLPPGDRCLALGHVPRGGVPLRRARRHLPRIRRRGRRARVARISRRAPVDRRGPRRAR